MGFVGDSRLLLGSNKGGAILWDIHSNETTEIAFPGMKRPGISLLTIPALAAHIPKMLWLMGSSEGEVELWDLLSGTRAAAWPALDGKVTTVAFSADARLIAAGTEHGNVKIWDLATQREVSQFSLGNNALLCLVFSQTADYWQSQARTNVFGSGTLSMNVFRLNSVDQEAGFPQLHFHPTEICWQQPICRIKAQVFGRFHPVGRKPC